MKTTQVKFPFLYQKGFFSFSQNRMLKHCFVFGISVFLILCSSLEINAQTNGDYRTARSGPWNGNSTWEVFNNGEWTSLAGGFSIPSSSSGNISILADHIVTISNASNPANVDQLTIEAKGQLNVNRPLNLVNGPGDDLIVNGTIINEAGIISGTEVSIVFNAGSNYEHNMDGNAIPSATWDPASNCILSGIAESLPTGFNQAFGNLIFNSSSIATTLPFGNSEMMLQGNLEIRNTGTGNLGFNQDKLTIGASLIFSGGNMGFASEGTDRTFDIAANFVMTNGSTFQISDGSAAGVLNVGGDFSNTGGTITHLNGSGVPSEINFTDTDPVDPPLLTGGGTFSGPINFNVISGAYLSLGKAAQLLDLSGSTGDFTNNGTLMGDFMYDGPGGNEEGLKLADGKALTNNGIVAPGNSVGTLVIIGDFISFGTLSMEIEDLFVYDQIIVTGNATINGTVAPEFISYTPAVNNVFDLIAAPSFTTPPTPALSITPSFIIGSYNAGSGDLLISALPIQLLSFSGQRQEDAIQLNWRTATEQNNDYMAVERAGSDFQFIEIGRVKGVGTTTEPQHYQFLDTAPLDGANYYRLRQVDFDGGTEYHPVIYVDYIETSRAAFLQVFPNPAQDRIRAAWQAGNDAPAQLRLFNASGQLLQSFRVNGDNGTYELPVDALSPGVYYLHLNQGNTNEQIRFVKH